MCFIHSQWQFKSDNWVQWAEWFFKVIEINNILTEMRSCLQSICLQMQCPCPPQQSTQNQIVRNNTDSQFYSKVSQTVQEQLKRQQQMHISEVDELNNQLFNLKNTVLRLQVRNQKDLQVERQLRREYNLLVERLKQAQPEVVTKTQYVQKIKEVMIEIDNRQFWQKQIGHCKTKCNDLVQQIQKLRTDKELNELQKQNLVGELNWSKKYAETLKDRNHTLTKNLQEKDELIKKLYAQVDYLKNNKQVVIQTKHLFPQFRQPQVVLTETKIQTIYAQKLIQKVVFVDVVKRVKQFIQPQKAVVNRIISCEQKSKCDCEQNINTMLYYKQQNSHLSALVQKLQNNVSSYLNERQNLVKVIADKNSELNRLQTTFKLISSNTPQHSYGKTGSAVNVTVTKLNQHRPTPRNTSITQQKQIAKK